MTIKRVNEFLEANIDSSGTVYRAKAGVPDCRYRGKYTLSCFIIGGFAVPNPIWGNVIGTYKTVKELWEVAKTLQKDVRGYGR